MQTTCKQFSEQLALLCTYSHHNKHIQIRLYLSLLLLLKNSNICSQTVMWKVFHQLNCCKFKSKKGGITDLWRHTKTGWFCSEGKVVGKLLLYNLKSGGILTWITLFSIFYVQLSWLTPLGVKWVQFTWTVSKGMVCGQCQEEGWNVMFGSKREWDTQHLTPNWEGSHTK